MADKSTEPHVAVIDLGSNSIKLLVAKRSPQTDAIIPVFATLRETRISAGISSAQPSIHAEAFAAGINSIVELWQAACAFTPLAFRLVATSAVRDAANGSDFLLAIHQHTGLEGEILTGEQEARAIARGIACDPALTEHEDFLQMDLGGGSFEFVSSRNGSIQNAISLQLGAVRMMERFVLDANAPIAHAARQELRAHVRRVLMDSGFCFEPGSVPLMATGGAFTVARLCLAAPQSGLIQDAPAVLKRDAIARLADEISALPLSVRAEMPYLPRQRADILPIALDTIVAALDYAKRTQCQHSLCNLRFGIAAEMLLRK